MKMAWRYRAIETNRGVGVCVYNQNRSSVTTWTDPIAPTANNTVELVRLLEMMVEDLKRGETPVRGGANRQRFKDKRTAAAS